MRLTFDEIKGITVGAIKTEQQDDGIHFFKCTKSQTEAWYELSRDLGDRSLCTTGVRLDFITNSRNFSFGSASGDVYELYVNMQLREQIFPNEKGNRKLDYSVHLSNQRLEDLEEYRVTLVFPSHHLPGVITYVEVDDGAYVKPCEYSQNILFIGDSITQGWQTSHDSLSYAYKVSFNLNANSVINGIGGAVFAESTFDKIDYDPDTVIIAYGTNDWGRYGRNPETIIGHAAGYLDLIKKEYTDKKVFVISPIWRCDSATGEPMPPLFDECRKMIEKEAEKRGFIAVDGLSMVPPVRKFFADGYLHPNDLGFSLYAESLLKVLNK